MHTLPLCVCSSIYTGQHEPIGRRRVAVGDAGVGRPPEALLLRRRITGRQEGLPLSPICPDVELPEAVERDGPRGREGA